MINNDSKRFFFFFPLGSSPLCKPGYFSVRGNVRISISWTQIQSAATKNSCQLFVLINNPFLCHSVPVFQCENIPSQFPFIDHTLNLILTKRKGRITQECSLCWTIKHLQEKSNWAKLEAVWRLSQIDGQRSFPRPFAGHEMLTQCKCLLYVFENVFSSRAFWRCSSPGVWSFIPWGTWLIQCCFFLNSIL